VATYYDIKGQKVQNRASDPSPVSAGQVWYNSTSNTAKFQGSQSASWSSGGNLNTSRSQLAGAGTQTAGLIFGGSVTNSTAPSVTNGAKTESYNGTSWTNSPNKNNATRQQSGFGIQTAAVSFGGYQDPAGYYNGTEEYNGSSWSNSNNYPSDISNGSGGSTGILTAGLNSIGFNGSSYTNGTNEYDGTCWTAGGTYPITGQSLTQFGTQTAAVGVGGYIGPPLSNQTCHYNGTAWTASNNMLVTAAANGRCGSQNDGMIYGGSLNTSYSNGSYLYDGTSWATNPATLSTGRGGGGPSTSSGSSSGAFLAGGDLSETTTYVNTEEFTAAGPVTKTITTS